VVELTAAFTAALPAAVSNDGRVEWFRAVGHSWCPRRPLRRICCSL